jgi:molybdopterin synthase catalytic subunit
LTIGKLTVGNVQRFDIVDDNRYSQACQLPMVNCQLFFLHFGAQLSTFNFPSIDVQPTLSTMIKITEKSIDVQKVIDTASSLGAGAVNVFIGTVRSNANGKNVVWLEYEAYETMAVAEIRKIIDEASHRWPLLGWAVSHRIGTLKPGEVSVVVAVSSPHRRESFEACQFIIDTLKANAPIWKKEVFEDGEEWVSARPAAVAG